MRLALLNIHGKIEIIPKEVMDELAKKNKKII